jgi:hypothetical protein
MLNIGTSSYATQPSGLLLLSGCSMVIVHLKNNMQRKAVTAAFSIFSRARVKRL